MSKKNDLFANIASMSQDFDVKGMEKPPVLATPDVTFSLSQIEDITKYCEKKMDTAEELYAKVAEERVRFAPFMEKLAPKMTETRIKHTLTDFLFKMEDDADWKEMKVPHYDGPVGAFTSYYKTTFEVTEEMMNQETIHVCFKGADYIASVLVNGEFIGRHEGFFAPFDFNITKYVHLGENELFIRLDNDFAMLSGHGDKIYAATGMGFDEPEEGWHHCPGGMGIFQEVFIETRSNVYLQNLFVRPMADYKNMELWAEVFSTENGDKDVSFTFSVFGQNFTETVLEDQNYVPSTQREIGVGDSLGEAMTRKDNLLGVPVTLQLRKGVNYFKIPFAIENAKIWDLDTPYLYQAQLSVYSDGIQKDVQGVEFGVRTFRIETECEPKGKLYFNDREIHLRGTNTMGHEQQDVYKGDFEQLITDILLAKVCNMNFFRLTQRPVQDEIYAYCDMLGIMTQTDMPLFGKIRINQYCECIRQAGEMELLVRAHPCNIMVSYINEPFPNAENAPHRNLSRKDMMSFFEAADVVVKMHNPDRAIKHVDGDYDPPSATLPDNHCYTMWYNGNGVDIGALNEGEWMPIKKGWHFGCGEFGTEGIDTVEVMQKYYPKHWIQTEGREAEWTPNEVTRAQTGNFHYFFFETPKSMQEWSDKSRAYQAESLGWQSECYRRNPLMVTCAVHLFIDAFPSNWMKTIMDYERTPKPAYFTFRNAMKPVLMSLRTRYKKVFGGTTITMQPFVCNDTAEALNSYKVLYQVDEMGLGGSIDVSVAACDVNNLGNIEITFPEVSERKDFTVRTVLVDAYGKMVDWTTKTVEVFPAMEVKTASICPVGVEAAQLVKDMGYDIVEEAKTMLISDYDTYVANKTAIDSRVSAGTKLIFMRLPNGEYNVCGTSIDVKFSAMLPLHFVSRDTGHEYVSEFIPEDFKYWYDESLDRITPILHDSFVDDSFTEILATGNANDKKEWGKAIAVGEKSVGTGKVIVCQLDVASRVKTNPVARMFVQNMLTK
ncbi:MAG: glycoside hydrolase family 2 TIM barrel-domain containing protein [Eubacteriales bacterium]